MRSLCQILYYMESEESELRIHNLLQLICYWFLWLQLLHLIIQFVVDTLIIVALVILLLEYFFQFNFITILTSKKNTNLPGCNRSTKNPKFSFLTETYYCGPYYCSKPHPNSLRTQFVHHSHVSSFYEVENNSLTSNNCINFYLKQK